MRNIGTLFVVLTVLLVSGCQQSQQENVSSQAGRKGRLMAAENINLNAELAKNKIELEKRNKLLQQYKQDIEKITRQGANDANEIKTLTTNLSQCYTKLEALRKQLEEYQKMVDLMDVPALCKNKVDKQKKLLEECQKEKEAIQSSASESTSFLMEKLPADLIEQVGTLTAENEQLKARIQELEKGSANTVESPKE